MRLSQFFFKIITQQAPELQKMAICIYFLCSPPTPREKKL